MLKLQTSKSYSRIAMFCKQETESFLKKMADKVKEEEKKMQQMGTEDMEEEFGGEHSYALFTGSRLQSGSGSA